jgi:hypothetical protein
VLAKDALDDNSQMSANIFTKGPVYGHVRPDRDDQLARSGVVVM